MSTYPPSACVKDSDNGAFLCPPRMSDGRHFTDYTPRCIRHFALQSSDKPMNSYELRQFTIANAEKMMDKNRQDATKKNECGPCTNPWFQGTMLPEQTVTKCDASTCKTVVNNPNGLGLGRDYGTPLDNEFISKMEAKNMGMKESTNKCTSSYDDLGYFPYSQEFSGSLLPERLSVPSGGKPF